ncbi:SDR family oxidoreductase [Aurantivibrio plasticivorans]
MTDSTIYLPKESQGTAPSYQRLKGRNILIVGGGQDERGVEDAPIGNGRAMAILFAREGAHVSVADKNLASAERTCEIITGEGNTAFPLALDVRNPEMIEREIKSAHNTMGGLDGLVYNVGFGNEMFFDNMTAESWDKVMEVNLRGAALTIKAALPLMGDGGAISITSSTASIKPGSQIPAYDASKAALAGLMRHTAFEGAKRNIRANVVAPGLMDTALGRIASQKRPSRAKTPIPLNRQGTGWEVAYMTLFLLSDEAAYITGQVMVVDGGLTSIR